MQLLEWWSLTLLCLAGALSPGPSWIIIITMSASRGALTGIYGALGHGFGVTAFAFITIFGLSSILNLSAHVSTIFSLLGIVILSWFGYMLIRSGHPPIPESNKIESGFFAGFSLALINPKVLVFFVAIFAPFVDSKHTFFTQLGMGLLAGAIDTIVYLSVAMLGMMLKSYLQSKALLWVNRGIGSLLMITSAWLLWKLV